MFLHSPLSVIKILIYESKVFRLKSNLIIHFINTLSIHRAKSFICCRLSNRFQRASFDALKLPTTETIDYVTHDMLPVCEILDLGKGPYTEISTLSSDSWLSKFSKV